MSFESTKRSIENLSKREIITLDLLFDMLVRVSMDVMEYNNTNDLCNTPIDDCDELLVNVYNLTQIMMLLCTENKGRFSEVDSFTQKEYEELFNEMNDVLSELSGTKEKIEKVREKKRELRIKQSELQESRGHLLTASEDCESLQRQIDELSDSVLDEKAKEKELLENDLSQRKLNAETLEKEKSELQAEVDKASEQIQSIKNFILTLQKEKEELCDEENSLLKEKNGLEKGIENLKLKLKEYEEWIKNYPTMSKQVQAEHDEGKAKITAMINAFNSAVADTFLKETLFKTVGAAENLSVENYPDCAIAKAHIESIQELQTWFDGMSKRINGLIEVYGTMLRAVVNQSDKLTKESDM